MRLSFASGPSLLAMAAMLAVAPTSARAQSFNASGTVVLGSANIVETAGKTSVGTTAPQVVINWSPTDTATGGGAINFQTAGTTAEFFNQDGTSLTVLNRVIPTDPARPIVFNGTVTSQLVDLATGARTRGGTLFFYSPGGIVVSPTGVFDVGNLVLSASDIGVDATAGTIGTAGTYTFLPAAAGSTVEVQNGARIIAGPANAYVALVAPKVINSGSINVDGSAVIVAADASTITFRPNGLFDIQIDQGTSAAGEVVTNDGTITGPAGGINTAHRVYMVAVPKNDAITMAIKSGSTLGFSVAGAADVDGNAIVLSAGYDITGGVIGGTRAAASGAVPATLAIGAINATSQLTGRATGQASVTVDSGNSATFASNLSLSGVQDPAAATTDGAFISVSGIGSTLDVTGDLQVTALDGGAVTGAVASDSGGASLTVDQGRLTVGGAASLSSARAPLVEVPAQAGNATLTARGGAVVNIGSDLAINASSVGKDFDDTSAAGPYVGTGGAARLSLETGSNVRIGGDLVLVASGIGGSVLSSGRSGAAGNGGLAVIDGKANGGVLDVTGATALDARGIGGSGQGCVSCTAEGGTGTGGNASIIASAGTNFGFGSGVTVNATGRGGAASSGNGKDGGAGLGGSASVRSTGGAVTFAQTVDVLADGRGGTGAQNSPATVGGPAPGGTGGTGTGGTASLAAGDALTLGGAGSIVANGATAVSAVGSGGNGGNGGAGIGGTATLSARNGSATGAGLTVRAYGDGGASSSGGIGGLGIGGNAGVIAYAAIEGPSAVSFGGSLIDARGRGGAGSTPDFFPDPGGAGGSGAGGQASALAEAGNADLVLGDTTVTAEGVGGVGGTGGSAFSSGLGGTGGNGGDGSGGSATLGVVTGAVSVPVTGSASFGASNVLASGFGGAGGAGGSGFTVATDGNGGSGFGGISTVTADAGTLNLTGALLGRADASGGSSGSGTGGNGQVGGTADPGDLRGVRLVVGTGQINAQAMSFTANGAGGTGATPGTASSLGHPLTWLLNGGSINAASLSFNTVGAPVGDAPASTIALTGGDTALSGDLVFNTPGDLTATLDGANVTSVNATIAAGDWLPGDLPGGAVGTLTGSTSVSLTTGVDLFAHMSVNSGGALTLSAPGFVRLDNLTSLDSIGVTAGSTVSLGAIQASDSVRINADGTVDAASISAGLVSPSPLSGATYGITVLGRGGVTLGNVAAARDILLLSPLAITSGTVSGREVGVLAGTGQTVGAINAQGRVLLADYEMVGFGGDPFGSFDFNAMFSSTVLPAGGPISVTGAVNAGSLTAASLGDVSVVDVTTTQALAANGAINLQAGGALATGALAASNRIDLTSVTTMNVTSASAGDFLAVDAGGALTAGNLGGAAGVNVKGGSTVSAGAVTATDTGSPITITSNGAMTFTSVAGGGTVNLNAAGGVLTGGGVSGSSVTVTGSDAVTLGDVTALTGSVSVTAANALQAGAVSAGTDVTLASTAAGVTAGNVRALAGAVGVTAAGATSLGAVQASTGITVGSGAGLTLASGLTDTGDLTLNATGGITGGNLIATGGAVSLNAGAALGAGNLAGVSVSATATSGLSAGTVNATGGPITLSANGDVTGGAMTATGTITLTSNAGGVGVGNLSSTSGAVQFSASLAGAAGAVSARTGISMTTGVSLALTSASSATGNVTLDAGTALTSGALAANAGRVLVTAGTSAVIGDTTAAGLAGANGIRVTAGTTLALGKATTSAGSIALSSTGALTAGDLGADEDVTVTSTGGALAVGDVTATRGGVALSASNAAAAGVVRAASGIGATAGGNLLLASASSTTGDVVLTATGNLLTGDLAATGGRLLASANGSAALGNLSAAGLAGGVGLRVSTGTTLSAGNGLVTTGELRLVSGGGMAAGDLNADAGALTLLSGGSLQAGLLAGHDGITLTATGDTTLGGAASSAAGNVTFDVTGGLTARAISATTGLVGITTTGSAVTGALSAGTTLNAISTGGALTTQSAAAGTDLSLLASGNLQTGDVNAIGSVQLGGANVGIGNVRGAAVNFAANGTLAFGDVTATDGSVSIGSVAAVSGGSITAIGRITQSNSVGAVTLGNLAAGDAVLVNGAGNVRVGNATSGNGTVELRARGGSITAGNIATPTDTALIASGNIAAGAVQARDMALLAGGNVDARDLISQAGRILIASNTLGTPGGAIGEFNFDAVFAAPLVATGGGLALTDTATGRTFTAAVAGDAVTRGISATDSILVEAGGTARLGGVWQSPLIQLTANDLDMPAGSGLNAGLAGTITLISRNASGMRIGDGLDTSIVPAGSFTLDNGEWSRINSGSFRIFARDVAGAVDLLIGKLDVTGPDAGSTIDDPLGTVQFTTGATVSGAPSGTIRIAGALRAVGLRATNALVFRTGQFQLASDTGSVTALGQGDTPTGTLQINARDIHVATASLLGQLAADPFFAGVEPALDRVSAGSNGPVIRAGALDFTVGRSFYIQRTGNGFDPLGFEEPLDGFRISQGGTSPIAVIINGTFRTATGLVSGAQAWLRFKQSGFNFSGFTADSRLNGCLLTAVSCGLDVRRLPDPGIAPLLDDVDTPVLDDSPPDTEERKPGVESAIQPPVLLLPVQPAALPGQIEEPIAGSGNPALIAGNMVEGSLP